MSQTINQHIEALSVEFSKLSVSRKTALKKKAIAYINANPGSADNNGFWKGLSARQVVSAACK